MRRRAAGPAAEAYARASLPSGRTPWREASFAVVDLETTGFDAARDEIIAWCVVPVDGARIHLARATEGLVRPQRSPEARSIRIHGLRAMDLAAGEPLDDAVDRILEAIAGRVLVAHAAWVERAFLRAALQRRRVRLRGEIVDTLALGRLHLLDRDDVLPPALSLDRLARELGLPVHRRHTASGDALTTAQIFLALAARREAQAGRADVRWLRGARRRLDAARLYRGAAVVPRSGRRESNPP
jgi:DNA polymerase III subunit epsilon